MAGIGFGTNYDVKTGNGLGPRTVIVSIAGAGGDVSQAELDGTIAGMTIAAGAGADAFTVAGVSGELANGAMYVALQGTGTVQTGAGDYYTGVTATVVTEFVAAN